MSSLANGARVVLNVASAATNTTGAPRSGMSAFGSASFAVVWDALTGAIGGTVKLQVSNDGTTWIDKSGASVVLAGASSSTMISVTNVTEEYYRAVWTKTGETGGTIVVTARATRR